MFSSLKKILPNTLLGKALFLLVVCRIIGLFCFSCFGLIYKIIAMFETNSDAVKRFFFNAEHSDGVVAVLIGMLFQEFFTYIQAFLVGAAELAIVWMIVYCCFRMARNASLSAMSFFWVSLITLGIEHLTNVFVLMFSPEAMLLESLKSAIPILTVFGVLTWFVHWVFLQNQSNGVSEKSREYFARVSAHKSVNIFLLLIVLATLFIRLVLVI